MHKGRNVSKGERDWHKFVGQLFSDHGRALLNYILSMGAKSEAEDIFQEAFSRACKDLDNLLVHKNPRAWLLRVARNAWIDWVRKPKPMLDPAAGVNVFSPGGAPSANLEQSARSELVQKVLDQMDDHYREVLAFRYWGELTNQDIAETLGITLKAAEVRVCRARKQFAEIYGRMEDDNDLAT